MVISMIMGGAAQAEAYKFGEVDVSVDTTLSAGIGMRTSKRDCSHVSLQNGGCFSSSGRATGINSDDGNLNFDQWDFTDAIARATVDIQAKWENYGAFIRPTAFYNLVYANNDMRFRDLNHDQRGQMEYDVKLLDAFVYGNYDIGGHATTIRIGKQALNWGESLFIQGGVNAFQAIDVTAIRTPGAELKDALTPMPMIYASFAATDALTLEAFWQFSYEKTDIDSAGSFFSTDDIVGPGSWPALSCTDVGCDNPYNTIPDGDLSALIAAVLSGDPVTAISLSRSKDQGQSDFNQFGFAAHYYADNVGTGTDFGLYFVRYSSRLPFLGFTNGGVDTPTACAAVTTAIGLDCTTTLGSTAAFAYAANQASYFFSFPTVNTLGASFSTTLGGTAVSGEATYSPDMPFGISDSELNASQIDGLGGTGTLSGGACLPPACTFSTLPYAPGVYQSTLSHIDLDAWQGQIGTITAFNTSDFIPSHLGADGGVFVVNAGFVYVPDAGDYPLNRSGPIGGISNPYAAALLSNGAGDPQYATSFSSGYRAVVSVDYNGAFGTSVNLSPFVQWRHDVIGYAPGPITAGYVKGLKEVTLGVGADYQSRIKASLSWTSTFGAGWYNGTSDRDFAMASVSYSF
ncbi:MAG: DUF1302 domain-containing protein [Parvibaculum sp.]|uniref:DUF1302 domain-containing protein n=1 Tax=Parvibaculum sp. TaxID=2024848 RepID=UPI0025FD984D|nr:DUF1302 domain-containing protein [Parvibaculum sp.]MCE9649427.1 DUF1302 domain-containing protein [Parvibaculum sp.]